LSGSNNNEVPMLRRILPLTLAGQEQLVEAEVARGPCQRGLVHDLRAHARERALARIGKRLHQELRDSEAEHRIAQELEPLVARRRLARVVRARAVGERLVQQLGPREAVAETFAQRGQPLFTCRRQ